MSPQILEATKTDKTLPAKGDWPEKVIWKLTVQTPEGPKEAEMFRLPTEPEPTGDVELEPTQYGLKAKFPRRGGGGRGRSPQETKAIQRQHSQEMALRYADIQAKRGQLPDDFKVEHLTPIIDWFERDIA